MVGLGHWDARDASTREGVFHETYRRQAAVVCMVGEIEVVPDRCGV